MFFFCTQILEVCIGIQKKFYLGMVQPPPHGAFHRFAPPGGAQSFLHTSDNASIAFVFMLSLLIAFIVNGLLSCICCRPCPRLCTLAFVAPMLLPGLMMLTAVVTYGALPDSADKPQFLRVPPGELLESGAFMISIFLLIEGIGIAVFRGWLLHRASVAKATAIPPSIPVRAWGGWRPYSRPALEDEPAAGYLHRHGEIRKARVRFFVDAKGAEYLEILELVHEEQPSLLRPLVTTTRQLQQRAAAARRAGRPMPMMAPPDEDEGDDPDWTNQLFLLATKLARDQREAVLRRTNNENVEPSPHPIPHGKEEEDPPAARPEPRAEADHDGSAVQYIVHDGAEGGMEDNDVIAHDDDADVIEEMEREMDADLDALLENKLLAAAATAELSGTRRTSKRSTKKARASTD